MSTKDNNSSAVIIGAGIGGLAAGCYLRMNGYATRILEMGTCCGGVSVAWKRGEYLFDGATNWLPGSGPGANLHALLAELFDFREMPFDDPEIFIQVERDGGVLRVYTDVDKLEAEMIAIAPQDRAVITELTAAIRQASQFSIPFDKPPEHFSIMDYIRFPFKNLSFVLFFSHWRRMTIREYASRFSSDKLSSLFLHIFPHHDYFSIFSIIIALGWMHARSGGYPFGGSNQFAALLEKRYRQLGGELSFRKEVEEILVRDNKAYGVRCTDGSVVEVATVISAADGYETLEKMLGGRFTPSALKHVYATKKVFPGLIQIGVGAAIRLDNIAHKFSIKLDTPLDVGGQTTTDSMMVRVCDFDPVFAPPGKTAFVVHLRVSNWKWWTDLRASDRDRYKSEKERIAQAIVDALEKRFPGVAKVVETIDVATPATFIRYTNIWQGSYQSWAPTPDMVGKNLPKTLPGLKNFYMAGQWVWPAGGLPGVIRIGRHVAQLLCKRDKRTFRSA